jgi:leucyl-tRNA synthetase
MDLRQHRRDEEAAQSMGLSLDWSREIATCDPAYYKHQRRMFLDFSRPWRRAQNNQR